MKPNTIYGNRKKLLIALWMLLACMFIAINCYGFMSMLDDPLAEPSREVKSVKLKYRDLENSAYPVSVEAEQNQWESFKQKFVHKKVAIQKTPLTHGTAKTVDTYETGKNLPLLSGILSISSTHSDGKYFLAVLDGKSCTEQDEVNGFKIDKITENAVTLTRKGRQWVLNAPAVRYSLSHGAY